MIFLGHIDAGKSTLGGSVLRETGMVDEHTMERYKKEAREAGRESWYLSWALDLNKEERTKGKTVEVGKACFTSGQRQYTILDAPGHKNYVPNMLGEAAQVDVGVLVISARKGEFEAGFENGGQTREHAILAKTQGVESLVVVVNKMDDPTVQWDQARFKHCVERLMPFLRDIGYRTKNFQFIPVSAQTGINVKTRIAKDIVGWYEGISLLEYLDGMPGPERNIDASFMMPISAKYTDKGTVVEGKIEYGTCRLSTTPQANDFVVMPSRKPATITTIIDEQDLKLTSASAGDQVRVHLKGVHEAEIAPGSILCAAASPIHVSQSFEAQLVLLDMPTILSAGYRCICHMHAAQREVSFVELLHKLDKRTGRKSKNSPTFARKGEHIIARLEVVGAENLCVERYKDFKKNGTSHFERPMVYDRYRESLGTWL